MMQSVFFAIAVMYLGVLIFFPRAFGRGVRRIYDAVREGWHSTRSGSEG